MRLSIIVPVYNMVGGGKLNQCLDSLLNQTISDYEVIAIDDASTDNSLEVLRAYESRYPEKLRVLKHEVNKRQGGAKNTGMRVATGEWIGFIDSDDWVTLDYYEKLLSKASETGADIVGCNYLLTDTTGKEQGTPIDNHRVSQTGILDEDKYKQLILHPGSMVIKIYKRSIFTDNNLFFPENIFYEDNTISAFPFLYAKRFEYVDECLYFYYQHNSSTVHTVSLDRCNDRVKATLIYAEECRKRGFYDRFREEIEYKIFELGYRNTLYSYLQSVKKPDYQFVCSLKEFLDKNISDIEQNGYYQRYMDEENKKFLRMHRKNVRVFLCYYKVLWFYRHLRYGK